MDTPLQVAFKDMETSAFLEGHIRERVAKLERFHPRIVSCRVVVEVPRRAPGSGKNPLAITIEIEIPGKKLIAKAEDEMRESKGGDRTAVFNRAFDAMQRQLEDNAQQKGRQARAREATGETGVIARLFREQNYGFVEIVGEPQLYFSRAVVLDNFFDKLEVGAAVRVTRAAVEGPMGPQASSIQRLGDHTHLY
ncbi:Ribosome-associated translation inhibitor RaiA [Arboricoccus pini]|uniref:Ribosome-associated translation inhibitor RaiA n=1 Tax=Arboricoccus pini TaxID=1963835 RepID=A0A212QWB8_9PROT|nr:HPF/RaiA family ribosome-associated protein [Arboricoccus pini]SNB64040.1 Ribosome-associated translation inhibitor RaiA [Arboricoccus pini]